jgi:hypothetical protein
MRDRTVSCPSVLMAALASVPVQLTNPAAGSAQDVDTVVDSALFQGMQWRSIGPS